MVLVEGGEKMEKQIAVILQKPAALSIFSISDMVLCRKHRLNMWRG